ncbi:MAG: hypothetical protein CL927_03540 [Deltaproteobacteria bacterium]|nr:hypothetical protein [Deltaproteobacteria bacterium]
MTNGRVMGILCGLSVAGCNGFTLDESQFSNEFFDADGDGVSRFSVDGQAADCDDTNPEISPRQVEVCDGIDNNCDELVDLPPAAEVLNGLLEHWADSDGDGYGDPRSELLRSCEPPDGYVRNYDDCDDLSADVGPDAAEVCDGLDNDCNAVVDDVSEGDATEVYFRDADADGYGTAEEVLASCEPSPPAGFTNNSDDCDDTNPYVNPGEGTIEVSRDGIDQDCDGEDDCTDLDCDGRPDGALGWSDSWVLPWFDGEEEGNVGRLAVLRSSDETAFEIGADGATTGIWVGDVDGDGYKDIIRAVGDGRDGERDVVYAEVHLGPFNPEHVDYPGAEASVVQLRARGATSVAVGDFDGNGDLDLVLGGPKSPEYQVDGTSVFMNASTTVVDGASLLSADLGYDTEIVHKTLVEDINSDGFDDLVVCHGPERDTVLPWGGGVFVAYGSAAGLDPALSVTDLDVDSCSDIAFGEVAGSDGTSPALVVVQGYGGAGADDLLWGSPVVIRVNADGSLSGGDPLALELAHTVQIVDLDGDGDQDLLFGTGLDTGLTGVVTDTWQTVLQVVENQGGFLVTRDELDLTSRGGMFPIVAPFDDADDRVDLVAPGHDNDPNIDRPTVCHLQSEGAFGFGTGIPLSDVPEWIHGTAYDYNGDGHLDVVGVRAPPEGGLFVIEGSADGLTENWDVILPGLTAAVPPILVE